MLLKYGFGPCWSMVRSMLLASMGVFLNMPLSRVICVTHYTGFPFGRASFTELLCWYGTVLSALPQFTSRNSVDPGWRQALRSSSGGKLLVPHVNTSTMQRHAFSVVAPTVWNSLPSQIRLLPKSCSLIHIRIHCHLFFSLL